MRAVPDTAPRVPAAFGVYPALPGTPTAPLTSCRLRSSGEICCRMPASSTCGREAGLSGRHGCGATVLQRPLARSGARPGPASRPPPRCPPPHRRSLMPLRRRRSLPPRARRENPGITLPSPRLRANLSPAQPPQRRRHPDEHRNPCVPARAGQTPNIPSQRLTLPNYPLRACLVAQRAFKIQAAALQRGTSVGADRGEGKRGRSDPPGWELPLPPGAGSRSLVPGDSSAPR